MAKLITVNSYFELFKKLTDELTPLMKGISGKNLVFCEEKVSLMAERRLCAVSGGSFNTEVYSFGNFLRVKKPMANLLSKEGSAMVVKKILKEIPLGCFKRSKQGLAPALFELIIQLKSAGVTPRDLITAKDSVSGILKDKITDVADVFLEYERYLNERGLFDQSSALTELPAVLERDEEITNANVFIVGFSGFTAQIRSAIACLLKRAKSVTAILTAGDNEFAFVNETKKAFVNLCKAVKEPIEIEVYESDYSKVGKTLTDGLFNPTAYTKPKTETDSVYFLPAGNVRAEIERIACEIKEEVMRGNIRYRDVTVILSDKDGYRNAVKDIFGELEIPYFLDEKKKPQNHPLITLITAYADAFRKGFKSEALGAVYKNPLFSGDKDFTDRFENYIIKYNVDYGRIKTPFTFPAKNDDELKEFENFRRNICQYLAEFNVDNLLNGLNVAEKLAEMTDILRLNGEIVESAVNEQIFNSVSVILSEMKSILGENNFDYIEFKDVFLSGVSALELSIIPQFNDAVFIGGFKEAALSKAEYLFCAGLTSAVPNVKEDVALLSDVDIDELSEIKVLIEPKIKVVNHRQREETALGISAFNKRLYLSYPITVGGTKSVKSEIIFLCEKLFTLNKIPEPNLYLTEKQGLKTFSSACGKFVSGSLDDFTIPTTFYMTAKSDRAYEIASLANKEVKERLNRNGGVLIKDVTSPTSIEAFYKCPYRFFVEHALRVKPREKGVVDGLSIGILMHEIFKEYVKNLSRVIDQGSSHVLFDEIKEQVLKREEYQKFLVQEDTKYSIDLCLLECEKFCYKTFKWLSVSKFQAKDTDLEVGFGDKKDSKYPPIKLLNGKVKISGQIDRIDTYGNYCRVIDYKTGSSDKSEKALFNGTKLQLWLYGAAVNDKTLAGAYYMPVSDNYVKEKDKKTTLVIGKSLDDKDVLLAQDENALSSGSEYIPVRKLTSESAMQSFIDYALILSEKAAAEMESGLIIASPYENACENCEFLGMCGGNYEGRKVNSVTESTIVEAVNLNKEKEDGVCPN